MAKVDNRSFEDAMKDKENDEYVEARIRVSGLNVNNLNK